MKKQVWIYYTAIVGVLPIIIRAVTALFMANISIDMFFSPIDFVFFGLTLNLSCINEMENLKEVEMDPIYKLKNNFWSIITLIFLSINLGFLYVQENSNTQLLNIITLDITSVLLCILSFGLSYKLIVKLNALSNE